MITRKEVRSNLVLLFVPVHVDGWLSNIPDDFVFNSETYTSDFIDYINSKADNPALTNTPL